MRPPVSGLMDRFGDRVEFLITDFDDHTLNKYRIRNGATNPPSFAGINSAGEVLDTIVGPVSAERLEMLITTIIDKQSI